MKENRLKQVDRPASPCPSNARVALIDAVNHLWGSDSEMIYLVLWMYGSSEAERLTSPEEASELLAIAAAGKGSGSAEVLRTRLRELHEHVYPELRLAA